MIHALIRRIKRARKRIENKTSDVRRAQKEWAGDKNRDKENLEKTRRSRATVTSRTSSKNHHIGILLFND
jgi:hypothetical protein